MVRLFSMRVLRPFSWIKDNLFNNWCWENQLATCKRKKLDSTKINSKWIKPLKVKARTIKLVEENIGEKLHDTRFGNDLLYTTLKAQIEKVQIDEWD